MLNIRNLNLLAFNPGHISFSEADAVDSIELMCNVYMC